MSYMDRLSTCIRDNKSLYKIYRQKAQRSYQKDVARVREGAKDSTISEGGEIILFAFRNDNSYLPFSALFGCLRLNCFRVYRLGI